MGESTATYSSYSVKVFTTRFSALNYFFTVIGAIESFEEKGAHHLLAKRQCFAKYNNVSDRAAVRLEVYLPMMFVNIVIK